MLFKSARAVALAVQEINEMCLASVVLCTDETGLNGPPKDTPSEPDKLSATWWAHAQTTPTLTHLAPSKFRGLQGADKGG